MKAKLFLACTLSTALVASQTPPPLSVGPTGEPTPGTLYRSVQVTMGMYQRMSSPPGQGVGLWLRSDPIPMSPTSMVPMRCHPETNRARSVLVKGSCTVLVMGIIGVIIWGVVKLNRQS